MAVKPIPDGYSSVTPYLIVDDGAAALSFYANAFGAVERLRMDWGDGKIGHAEFTVGDSVIMMASEFPEMDALSPKTIGGTPVRLAIFTENVDEMFARAIAEGATEIQPVQDQFYGDRLGMVQDPYGHLWTIATHVEDVSPEELARRSEALRSQSGPSD